MYDVNKDGVLSRSEVRDVTGAVRQDIVVLIIYEMLIRSMT